MPNPSVFNLTETHTPVRLWGQTILSTLACGPPLAFFHSRLSLFFRKALYVTSIGLSFKDERRFFWTHSRDSSCLRDEFIRRRRNLRLIVTNRGVRTKTFALRFMRFRGLKGKSRLALVRLARRRRVEVWSTFGFGPSFFSLFFPLKRLF